MEAPAVQVLGVYRVSWTPDLQAEAMALKYGGVKLSSQQQADAEAAVRSEIAGVVLVEVAVFNRDATFDVGDCAQPGSDQAPYDEVYLDSDGTAVVAGAFEPPEGRDLRVAFFLHFFDPTKPLKTSYGVVPLPAPERMPERLQAITKYEPVD